MARAQHLSFPLDAVGKYAATDWSTWARSVTSAYSVRLQDDPEARFTAADLRPLVGRFTQFISAQNRLESQLRLLGAETPGPVFYATAAAVGTTVAASPPTTPPPARLGFFSGAAAAAPVRLTPPPPRVY